MNLRRKVIAASAAMLFTSTVGLGGLAIGITYQQGVSNVQAELEDLMELIETQEDPLAAALYEFDGLSVNVGYKLDDGSITMLQEVFVSSGPEDEISQELDLGYGEALIVSKSINDIRDLVNQLLPIVLLSSLGFSVLSGLVLYGVLRRDVQGIRSLAKFAKDTTVGEVSKIQSQRVSSEIQELAESMQVMVATLEQNQENMRDFLSDSSHELKTPLTVIRGYVEILQKESRDETTSERLGKIHREAIKMQNLVADLLLLAEIESNTPIKPSDFNLGELVEEVIENQRVLAPQLSFVSSVGTDVLVYADRVLIDRYLTNALSNIRLHTPGNTTAWIAARVKDSKVHLTIEDNGPGLPRELMASQDIRFHRESADGGTGLGLSIMKGVVRKHDGELLFETSAQGGLKLTVRLPRD